jgi:hypothetical protein
MKVGALTDIAKYKSDDPAAVIGNWLRNRNTIEYLGLWEILYNPGFKPLEFEEFRRHAGLNAYTLSPQKWAAAIAAIGIFSKSGKYGGGAYAHKDIAFKFASWISTKFELYFIREFQRLKELKPRSTTPRLRRFVSPKPCAPLLRPTGLSWSPLP